VRTRAMALSCVFVFHGLFFVPFLSLLSDPRCVAARWRCLVSCLSFLFLPSLSLLFDPGCVSAQFRDPVHVFHGLFFLPCLSLLGAWLRDVSSSHFPVLLVSAAFFSVVAFPFLIVVPFSVFFLRLFSFAESFLTCCLRLCFLSSPRVLSCLVLPPLAWSYLA
jgi:hypothetical protein